MGKKSVFHVKHTPIEEPPAFFGSARYEGMGAWLETDDGTARHQFSQGAVADSVNMHFPSPSGTPESQPVGRAITNLHFSIDLQASAGTSYQTVHRAAAKTSAMRQQVDRFQHTALARSVGPDQLVKPGCRVHAHIGQTAQVLDLQAGNMQTRTPSC